MELTSDRYCKPVTTSTNCWPSLPSIKFIYLRIVKSWAISSKWEIARENCFEDGPFPRGWGVVPLRKAQFWLVWGSLMRRSEWSTTCRSWRGGKANSNSRIWIGRKKNSKDWRIGQRACPSWGTSTPSMKIGCISTSAKMHLASIHDFVVFISVKLMYHFIPLNLDARTLRAFSD